MRFHFGDEILSVNFSFLAGLTVSFTVGILPVAAFSSSDSDSELDELELELDEDDEDDEDDDDELDADKLVFSGFVNIVGFCF